MRIEHDEVRGVGWWARAHPSRFTVGTYRIVIHEPTGDSVVAPASAHVGSIRGAGETVEEGEECAPYLLPPAHSIRPQIFPGIIIR